MRFLVAVFLALTLPACGIVYRIDVQQGNYVTQDVVAKLKKGMTKSEVKQLLGTPLLTDAFHGNRWDYYFTNLKTGDRWESLFGLLGTPKGRADERTRFSVFFDDDKLVAVTGDVRAAPPAAPTTPTTPPAPKS